MDDDVIWFVPRGIIGFMGSDSTRARPPHLTARRRGLAAMAATSPRRPT